MNETGFVIVPNLLSTRSVEEVSRRCEDMEVNGAGTRNLLDFDWVRGLSQRIREHPVISRLVPKGGVAAQCTYFKKTPEKNWLVPLHRDESIPVRAKFESDHWGGWSLKEGTWFARPPRSVLSNLVAVRVHLEENNSSNGALQLVPGSHKSFKLSEPPQICVVPKGGALVMSPLVLHASSKSSKGRRRVLHFLYGPKQLPNPADWAHAM